MLESSLQKITEVGRVIETHCRLVIHDSTNGGPEDPWTECPKCPTESLELQGIANMVTKARRPQAMTAAYYPTTSQENRTPPQLTGISEDGEAAGGWRRRHSSPDEMAL